MSSKELLGSNVKDGFVDALFVFVGFFIAKFSNKYLQKVSFLSNAWVDGIVWLVLGWLVMGFMHNKYISRIGIGLIVEGFDVIVGQFIS